MRLSDVGSLGRVSGLGQTPSAAVAASDAAVAESWRKTVQPWVGSGKEGYMWSALTRRGNFVFVCRTDSNPDTQCNDSKLAPEVSDAWFYTGAIPGSLETMFKTAPLPQPWSYGGPGKYKLNDKVIDTTPGYGTGRVYKCISDLREGGCNTNVNPKNLYDFWRRDIPIELMSANFARPTEATVLASVAGKPPLAATNVGVVTVKPAAVVAPAPVTVPVPAPAPVAASSVPVMTSQGLVAPGLIAAPVPVAAPVVAPVAKAVAPSASVLTSAPAPAAAPAVTAATAPMVVAPGVFAKPAPVVSSPVSASSTSNMTVTPFVPVGAPAVPGAAGAGVTAAGTKSDERSFYMRPAVVVGAVAGTAVLTAFFMRKKGG